MTAVNRNKRKAFRTLRTEQLESRRLLATLVVNLASDTTGNDGDITLREAVSYVNGEFVPALDQAAFDYANLGTNDKIVFNPEVFGVGLNSLGQPRISTVYLEHGALAIGRSVVIDGAGFVDGIPGPGWENLTIDASQYVGDSNNPNGNTTAPGDGARIFSVSAYGGDAKNVVIRNLSLTGGDASGDGGAIYAQLTGSPSFPTSTLELSELYIHHNQTGGSGGGIYVDAAAGQLVIDNIIVEANQLVDAPVSGPAARGGGGVAISNNDGDVSIDRLVARLNEAASPTAPNYGGGLWIEQHSGATGAMSLLAI